MEPLVLMFYYVNVDGMSRQAAEELIHRTIKYTKLNLEYYNVIQQYFPVRHKETYVEVITVPNIAVENEQIARQINSNLNRIVGQFEQNSPIETIEDLYG